MSLTAPLASAANFWWDGGTTTIAGAGDGTSTGGAGDWSTAIGNWDDGAAHVSWPTIGADNDAIFGGAAGGAVNLATAITANDLTFDTTGYTIGGTNALTLNGTSIITTNAAATTISAPIAGVGFTKAGSGTLTLSSTTSSFTGLINLNAGTLSISADTNLGNAGNDITFNGGTLLSTLTTGQLNLGTGRVLTVGAGGGTISTSGSGTAGKVFINGANLLTGSGPLTKTGASVLQITGSQNYSGAFTISGLIECSTTGALGTSTVTLTKAGEVAVGNTTNLSNSFTISSAGSGSDPIISAIGGGGGIVSGGITLNGPLTVALRAFNTVTTGNNLTISGALSGTGNLTIAGPTTPSGQILFLSGNNSSYSGNIVAPVGTGVSLTAANSAGTGTITINTTAASLGVMGVGYNGVPTFTNTRAGATGGVFAINTTTYTTVVDQSSGQLAGMLLGSSSTGTYQSTTLTPDGTNYRLGGGGGTLTLSATNVLTGTNNLIVGDSRTVGGGTIVLSANNDFTGTTTVNNGSLSVATVAAAGTAQPLGQATSALTLGSTTLGTLLYSGTTSSTDRAITVGGAGGGAVNVSTTATALTLSGIVTATSGAFNKTGTGKVILSNASNNLSSGVTINAGTLELGGNARLGSTANVTMNATSTTFNLGGFDQTLGTLTVANTGAAATNTITNGNLTVTGGTAFTLVNSTAKSSTTVDLKGLNSFTFNQPTKAFQVNAGYNANVAGDQSILDVSLAGGTSGTNSITASVLDIGTIAPGVLVVTGNTTRLHLGKTNTINTNTINLGTGRNQATLDFQTGLTNPTAILRGNTGGTSRMTTVNVAVQAAGGSLQVSDLDFSLGSVDGRIGTLKLSEYSQPAGTAVTTGNLKLAAGTLDITTLMMSNQSVLTTSGTGTLNSTVTQTGGTMIVGTLTLGNYTTGSTGTLNTLNPTYALGGGVLTAQTINANAGGNTASVRKIDWTGGTIQNFNDTATTADLTISGASTAAHEKLNINLLTTGANSHTFMADSGRSINVQNTATISGAGSLLKTGAGILQLLGDNTYGGGTIVSAGSLVVNNTSGSATGSGTVAINGGMLGGTGTISGATSIASGATLAPGNSIGTLNLSSSLALADGALFNFELAAPGTNDLVNTSALTLNSQDFADFTFVPQTGFGAGNYVLFDANSISGTLGSSLTGLINFGGTDYNATLAIDGANNNVVLNVAVAAIPEPSTLVVAGLGMLGFAGGLLRRRRFAAEGRPNNGSHQANG